MCLTQVLLAKKTDHRADLFSRAVKAGADIQASNRKLLLRMRLCACSFSSYTLAETFPDNKPNL